MADVEVVIKISEELYNRFGREYREENLISKYTNDAILEAFCNGTPLPKGCDVQRIIPKRVDIQKWIYTKCPNPNCNHKLSTHHGDGYYSIEHKPDFCPNCGQALLWESEE